MGLLNDEQRERYQRSVKSALQALELDPLSIEARANLVNLDFVYGDSSVSLLLLEQLADLQRRNGRQLIRLARMGARRDFGEYVQMVCRRATEVRELTAAAAVDIAIQCESADAVEAIARVPLTRRLACSHLLQSLDKYPQYESQIHQFLRDSLDELGCPTCKSRQETVRCERLNALMLIELGEREDSLDHFRKITEIEPANAQFRVDYIRQLTELGRNQEARVEARKGRSLFPNNGSFQAIIDEIARRELGE